VYGLAQGLTPGQITDVYEDRGGQIWAVGSGGIHKFEHGRFRSLRESQALPGRAVFAMREDDAGAWWLATLRGLVRVGPGELDRAFADSRHTMQYRTFDRLDGLPGSIAVTKLPMLVRSTDGRIWIAADEGVAVVDPREVSRDHLPLHALVEAVRVGGHELSPADVAVVPAGTSDLEIDYTATSLSIAERIQFRYRLEGVDTVWRDVGTRRRAYYTNLAPGSYRFLVSANGGDGHWENAVPSVRLRVLPAWYQTDSFIVFVVLLIGSLGGALVWLVQRRRHAHSQAALERQYEVTMAERVRIAEDLHDTLLQGFAGVNLQLIAAERALPAQPDVAAETIVRVQRLTEESLREARERVWEMRDAATPGTDLATTLEQIAKERALGRPLEVAINTTGRARRLPPLVEDAAFRIGREAIVNVVRHADASRLEIDLNFRAKTFDMEVRDNGRGVKPNEAAEARARGHFGLSSIQNRASVLGGRCDVRPRADGGTVIALELPLARS
jgi:signal transduction histidine kinase